MAKAVTMMPFADPERPSFAITSAIPTKGENEQAICGRYAAAY